MLLRVLRLRRVRAAAALPSSATASSSSARQRLEHVVLSRARLSSTLPVGRTPVIRVHARLLSSSSTATDTTSPLSHETLVQSLKSMCNALFNDNRDAPPAQRTIDEWAAQIASFQAQIAATEVTSSSAAASALTQELRIAYESAIAIASKQRQFDLVHGLFTQMQTLNIVPTDATFVYAISDVALALVTQPVATPAPVVRELVASKSNGNAERLLLEIVRCEEYAHYRKTPVERQRFHASLIDGIESLLDQYEVLVALEDRTAVPYNKALAVFAANDVTFTHMLQLMVKRSVVPDAATYAALLQGARWTEIPATLSQLLTSGVVDQLTTQRASSDATVAAASSAAVAKLWTSAMKAIVHSYSERFFDRKVPVHADDLVELQKVLLFADKQLERAFRSFAFHSSNEHADVFALRTKAAATAGLTKHTLRLLDDYVAGCKDQAMVVSKQPFLCAFELLVASQLAILHLPRDVVQARTMHSDVRASTRVSELEKIYSRISERDLPASTAALAQLEASASPMDRHALRAQQQVVAAHKRTEQAIAKRLDNARIVKSYQLLIHEQFEAMDKTVDAIVHKLQHATGVGSSKGVDMDVTLKLLEQLMTCANRFELRLRTRQRENAPQLMRRVFRVLKPLAAAATVDDADVAHDPTQLRDAFHLGVRTAVLLWRFDDANKLVRKQKRVLASASAELHPHSRLLLDAREYELLIFQHVADRNLQAAYALLQEMHNAGVAPPKEAIHRIVLGVLHQLHNDPQSATRTTMAAADDESDGRFEETATYIAETAIADSALAATNDTSVLDTSDTDTIESELAFQHELTFDDDDSAVEQQQQQQLLMLGADAPRTVADLTSFLQDWYNLHSIRPAAKTVVPLFAYLLQQRDLFECKRLLQILDAMDGGLTPATTVWLEMRLARIGKTIDDLRVVVPRR